MKFYLSLIFILVLSLAVLGQRTRTTGSAAELRYDHRASGHNLYAYDIAAWHSTDAVLALKPAEGSFGSYIGQKKGNEWVVVYGKLSPKRDAFLVAYEATQGASASDFTVRKFEPAKEDKGFSLVAALSIELAKTDFGKVDRPYNVAVLSAPANQLYALSGPYTRTVSGIFPLGGNVRYLVSADGKKIVEKRQMHKSIIEFQLPKGQTPESGYHTAIMDDIPEDSDVFHVLTRQLPIPELIVTSKYVYQVKADGSISYIMTREAFLKIGKPSN